MATELGERFNHTHKGWHSQYLKYQTVSKLIVSSWTTGTVYGLVGAMMAAIVAAVTYECIHEYLRYLRHRAVSRSKGSGCCGTPVFSCQEKFIFSIIQMIRVTVGYFMVLCVMTMNIWILAAVVIGAAIGYGVGKPLVANAIMDIVTSHGYEITRVDQKAPASKSHRASQRSSSWRYQPINLNDNVDGKLMEIISGIEERNTDNVNSGKEAKNADENGAEIIWIRRSLADLQSESSEVFASEPDVNQVKPEVQLRNHSASLPSTSQRTNDSTSSFNSSSRLRSTGKTINDSFRSEGDENYRSVTIRSDSYTIDYDSHERRKQAKMKQRSSKSIGRSSSTPPSRFKPISKHISREQSFSSHSFELS